MDMTYAETTTELVVDVDADYAQRVVTTVLRAAVRFGKRGGRIGIESVVDRPGVAQVNIWNDGQALAPETITAMLPPEPRPGEPEKEPQVGLGLTLVVARGLARLMKGEVVLQSKTGVGNRFIVEFPIES
jgi:signal transduction histidine kinase